MNNKGFTLVELIATIALLAVIAIISFVSINEVVNQSKVSDCENLLLSIKSAAKEYVSDNRYNNDFDNDNDMIENITSKMLIDNNYLSDNIVSPFDNNKIIKAENIKIQIQLNSDYTAKKVDLFGIEKLEDGSTEENMLQCIKEQWNKLD